MTPTAAAGQAARAATMNDVPAVVRVLGRAFHDDPLSRRLFPDDALRMGRNARACALPAGRATVRVSPGKPARDPVVRGAALWTPPNTRPDALAVLLRSLPHRIRLVGWHGRPR